MNSVKRTGADCVCWLSISRKAPWPRVILGGTGGGGGGGKARGTTTSLVNSPNLSACYRNRNFQ